MNSREPKKSAADNAPLFTGLYQHEIDAEGRILLPAPWRLGTGDTLYAMPWPLGAKTSKCILVVTSLYVSRMRDGVAELPAADPEGANLRRVLGADLCSPPIEPNGKITLPETLLRAAGLASEATLVGMLELFQIWDPQRFEDHNADDAGLLPNAFRVLG